MATSGGSTAADAHGRRPLAIDEALAQIRHDLGLPDAEDGAAREQQLLARAAADLGIELPGRGLRSDVQHVCIELGIETHWAWTPAKVEVGVAAAERSGDDGGELSHSGKVSAIFAKFDEDGDGRLPENGN